MVCQQQESQGRKEGDKRKSRERERTYKERENKKAKGSTATFCDKWHFSSFFGTSPWKMRMWKKVSSRRMRSGVILVESRRTGYVCEPRRGDKISLQPTIDTNACTHLWWSAERVSVENGLNHNKTLCNIFTVELVAVVGRLVWAVVEHLEELRATQVKHKLRERGRT